MVKEKVDMAGIYFLVVLQCCTNSCDTGQLLIRRVLKVFYHSDKVWKAMPLAQCGVS